MTEVAASRPPAGLSLSAENLHALDPAPLDDLVESEVIVGDDSDDEFAFNGEVKEDEEIYIQNGPRGPSMTVGHLTIEHSYCTPEPDDEPAVKLLDPDRFSDFFLMEEAGSSPAGGAGHVQLFTDMRQCVAGGALSYLQVSGAAVLSSLQQVGRRLESLTEEDESEAAQEPPARAVSLPAPGSAAALSPPTSRAAAAAAPPVPTDARPGADMAAESDVWGGGVARDALDGGAAGSADSDSEAVSGPVAAASGVEKMKSTPSDATTSSQEKHQPADASRSEEAVTATAVSKPSELPQSDAAPPVHDTPPAQPPSAGSPSDLTQPAAVASSSESAQPVTDPVSRSETAASPTELTQSATLSSIAEMTQSMTAPSPPAQCSPPALMSQSLGPISFSDPFHVAGKPVGAATEVAEDPPEAVSLVSPVEPATAISGPVSLVGIVLPTAAAAPPADAPASGTLWGAAAAPADNAAAALPVLKIDESVDLKGEGERDGATSSSDRSTPPRLGRSGGRPAAARPGSARASPRSSLTARAQQDLAKTRSSSTTREEKRALSSYGTLPRRGKKTPPSSEAGKKEELPAVSEIARKQPVAAAGRPATKPAAGVAPLRRRPMDKKVSELKKSESAPTAGGSELPKSRKPSAEAELKSSADKYGTLTRRKEPKPAAAAAADGAKSAAFTAEELKRGADTFGTLGRRKKTAAPSKPAAPARPEPAQKSAAAANGARPAAPAAKTTSPRPATAVSGAARRPAGAGRPLARPAGRSAAAPAAGKTRERTLICLETGCQTVLTGGDLSAAASLRPQPAVTRLEAACPAEIASPQAAQQAGELARLQAELERARQAQEQLQQLQVSPRAGAARLTGARDCVTGGVRQGCRADRAYGCVQTGLIYKHNSKPAMC